MGGVWSYPREDFALRETGLATVIPDPRPGRATADGEIYDPALLTAAHRTLQLPAILVVTNLENGLSLRVRVNDRGPAQSGRVVALSAARRNCWVSRPAARRWPLR
ncbi:septal ring lytic transglycosylase RlpA family protein [Pseudoroseomonas wenyumeiae]